MVLLCAAGLVGMVSAVFAQPVGGRMLNDVEILSEGPCYVVRVGLNFPVRYITHAPLGKGKELRIQLEAIALSRVDRESRFKREAVTPHAHEHVPLRRVIYEGDIGAAPYLTLEFGRPVSFKVGQGSDFRSLFVAIPGPEATDPCLPVISR
ncbi:MAG: hypothetical protein ACE5E4_05660 [Candidatus Binatia bacterium]